MSEITKTTTLEDQLVADLTKDQYTPYQMIKAFNDLLPKYGVEKVLPTQMGYQYCERGYIKAERITVTMKKGKTETREGWTVSKENAVEWFAKYITKNTQK